VDILAIVNRNNVQDELLALYAIDDSIAASSIFALAFPFAFHQFAKTQVGSDSASQVERIR
jgi:hypothetical protein